jgi:dihydrodipicolinate synthase/N-acetylneuraminate lyase
VQSLVPHVGGILGMGSTGDGWELDEEEYFAVLGAALDTVPPHGIGLLVGALRREADTVREFIREVRGLLKFGTSQADDAEAMAAAGVQGFTICPPCGPELAQDQIRRELAATLDLKLPMALYQLPQVTGSEMSPATVASLAAEYANFYLLKDTSGRDTIAASGVDLGGVFLVRGAEGDYSRWLDSAGGPYGGFLLSTAKCFAAQLHGMIELLQSGRQEEARAVIEPVEKVVAGAFDLVARLPDGNPFANANKAIDHFLAHGPAALHAPPPRLHAGSSVPKEILAQIGDLLRRHDLMPQRGYL